MPHIANERPAGVTIVWYLLDSSALSGKLKKDDAPNVTATFRMYPMRLR